MKKRNVLKLAMAFAAMAFAAAAQAQPANDNCSSAAVAVDGDNLVNTKLSTLDGQIACTRGGGTYTGPGVWFTYTAPATGIRNFTITSFRRNSPTSGGNRDSILAIFDACSGNLLACDDDGYINQYSKIYHFPVTGGTNYIIWVGNWGPTTSELNKGIGTLNIAPPPAAPLPIDDCELAAPLMGQGAAPFNTLGLTNSDSHPWDCDPFWFDGWIAWTPSLSGVAVIDGCAADNSSALNLSIYESCGSVPLVCNNAFQDDPAPFCLPKLCATVTAGHTYYVRYGVLFDTSVCSGNINFEVRPPNAGVTIPAGAITEPGNCSDVRSADLNGGCNVNPPAFTQYHLCETYSGIASARLQPLVIDTVTWLSIDSDWYEFTLETDQAVTVTGESEFAPFGRIVVGCPGTEIKRSPFWSPSCSGTYSLGMTTNVLVAGTYYYVISPQAFNGLADNDCTHGSRYWFKITGADPCPPTNENCCRGTTCNSIAAGSCTGTVAGSASITVASCGSGAGLTSCCYADFNHDGTQSIDDLFLYFNAYFTGSPWANYGGDGVETPTIDDLFLYINAYFTGCS